MTLDDATISLAGGLVTFFSGLSLLVYWWYNRRAWAALWWAVGHCGSGTGIILVGIHDVLPSFVSNIAAPLLFDLSAPFALIAARIFNRGSVNRYRAVGGIGAWMTAAIVASMSVQEHLAAAFGVATSAAFYAAAAREFWLGRGEELRGRIPILVTVSLFAVTLFLLAAQFALATEFVPVATTGWLGAVQFIALVYAPAVALFLTMMLNDRSEKKYLAEALSDPLTGLANRRAFMDRSQRMLDRQGHDRQPVSLFLFDLDRFKRINDTFGHPMGDRVLRAFADVLVGGLQPADLGARLGGEEFVALALGIDGQAAVAIANRVRDAFQKVALFMDGQRIDATVSVGIAASAGMACTITDMMAEADAALYRAKSDGRNRVVIATPQDARRDPHDVVRIA